MGVVSVTDDSVVERFASSLDSIETDSVDHSVIDSVISVVTTSLSSESESCLVAVKLS